MEVCQAYKRVRSWLRANSRARTKAEAKEVVRVFDGTERKRKERTGRESGEHQYIEKRMVNYANDIDNYSSEEVDTWISQFCSMFGHDYFVEVTPEFIEDDFNLTGLSSVVPYYKQALDVILDLEPETAVQPTDIPLVEHAAELLYGLIHARFILTKQGLHAMAEKYEENCFGACPRYYCDGMHLIPIGRFDSPGIETVRLYCPNCNDIYLPSSSRYLNIDGAFFGTSFVGLFMKMFPEIDRQTKQRTKDQFQLKLFGFRLNEAAPCGPRMKWLRCWPSSKTDMLEYKKCEFEIPDVNSLQNIYSGNGSGSNSGGSNADGSSNDSADNRMEDDEDENEDEEDEEEEVDEDEDEEEGDGRDAEKSGIDKSSKSRNGNGTVAAVADSGSVVGHDVEDIEVEDAGSSSRRNGNGNSNQSAGESMMSIAKD